MSAQAIFHLQSALRITELIKSAAKSGKIHDKALIDKAMRLVEQELNFVTQETQGHN